jgi:DNA topoisomerase-3
LSKAELTGEWEYKLAQMELGRLSRDSFMADIAAMTERIVRKAKEYDRDTVPGNYATLATPCPNCGGVVKENYRRYACTGPDRAADSAAVNAAKSAADGAAEGCGFSIGKSPGGRTFELPEVEAFLRDKRIGPLEGFRSKAGWPFTAEIALKFSEEDQNWKLEFDFGDDAREAESGEIVELQGEPLGACPKCSSRVFEHGSNYLCERSVPTTEQPTPSCDFKTGKIILQQPIDTEQLTKLLTTGKTDLLEKFISNKTRRAFKAFLTWSAEEGKVVFGFEPRASKFPPRKTAGSGRAAVAAAPASKKAVGQAASKAAAKTSKAAAPSKAASKAAGKTTKPATKPSAKAATKPATKAAASLKPSAALAAVIGPEATSRTEVMKKLWDYIKAKGLQDPKDKRTILADAPLKAVFGKDSAGMFELAGIMGQHLQG